MLKEMLDHFDNDLPLLKSVAEIYLNDYPGLLLKLQQAVAMKDFKAVSVAAHTIKGAAANFSSSMVVRVAAELELIANSGDIERCNHLLRQIQQESADLADFYSLPLIFFVENLFAPGTDS